MATHHAPGSPLPLRSLNACAGYGWPSLSGQMELCFGLQLARFFGFLRAGEFTVPSADAYDQTSHLSLSDVALDSHTNPSTIRLVLKQSKTERFCQGMEIFGPVRYRSLPCSSPPTLYWHPPSYSGPPLRALHRASPYQGIPGRQFTVSSQAGWHGGHAV